MIAFYALSGFFQSTGGSCSYSTITKWTPRRKRGTFSASGISLTTSAAPARRAWRCLAPTTCLTARDRDVYLPVDYCVNRRFYRPALRQRLPESYGLGNAEELFGEEISEEDKETEENAMTKWQIFVEYVLKNKVIWLLCFSNIFLYVVRIGIDQWSTVYAFRS